MYTVCPACHRLFLPANQFGDVPAHGCTAGGFDDSVPTRPDIKLGKKVKINEQP